MKKTALVIMAAGIGSRYGSGIKQLASVDDCGHIIMDYSIHDAIKAGFNKIVFIIRKDIEDDFKEVIGNRIEAVCGPADVEVAYCFQDLRDVPGEFPEGRTKPWGTGQAVLAAEEHLDVPFGVINADDYYGKDAFYTLHDWLIEEQEKTAISMVGFILKNTLSDNGSVTRGICKIDEGHTHVSDVIETRNIIKTPTGASADGVDIDVESYVSMNMWGFPAKDNEIPDYMNWLTTGFAEFFKNIVPENPMKSEYLLPIHIGGLLRNGTHTVKMLPSEDKWFGITYVEDIDKVKASFKDLIDKGIYSDDLFSDI